MNWSLVSDAELLDATEATYEGDYFADSKCVPPIPLSLSLSLLSLSFLVCLSSVVCTNFSFEVHASRLFLRLFIASVIGIILPLVYALAVRMGYLSGPLLPAVPANIPAPPIAG